jgi:hypothetical protein
MSTHRAPQHGRDENPRVSSLVQAWFEMTREEQRALIIILSLLIIGVLVRAWHICF